MKLLKLLEQTSFFDDQDVHLEVTSKDTPSAKVPYHEESILNRI